MKIWLEIADRLDMCGDIGADKVADFFSCAGVYVELVEAPLYNLVVSRDIGVSRRKRSIDTTRYPFRDLPGLWKHDHARNELLGKIIRHFRDYAAGGEKWEDYDSKHKYDHVRVTVEATRGTWYTERNGAFNVTLFINGEGAGAWYERAAKLRASLKANKDGRTESAKEASRAANWRPSTRGKVVACE